MRKTSAYILLLLCFLLASCAGGGKKSETATVSFPLPAVPSMLEGEERLEYITYHYWDALADPERKFPCEDSTIVRGVKTSDVEQAVSNYIMLCGNLPLEKAERCIFRMAGEIFECERVDSSSNVYDIVGPLMERYLYDPNSPIRDEDLYRPYAEALASSGLVDSTRAGALREDARLCALNRRGAPAADFRYCERSGHTGSLYKVKAEYVVLFFSNPGCHACKEIIETLSSDETICRMVSSGTIAVLNIYIDEDLGEWYNYMPIYPKEWVNAYDPDHLIRDDELYSVRAIPSLYLLDKDKKVLLKDATTEKLMSYIYETVSRPAA